MVLQLRKCEDCFYCSKYRRQIGGDSSVSSSLDTKSRQELIKGTLNLAPGSFLKCYLGDWDTCNLKQQDHSVLIPCSKGCSKFRQYSKHKGMTFSATIQQEEDKTRRNRWLIGILIGIVAIIISILLFLLENNTHKPKPPTKNPIQNVAITLSHQTKQALEADKAAGAALSGHSSSFNPDSSL